jgi:myo-inositol-1(or 4)-monophosphatase
MGSAFGAAAESVAADLVALEDAALELAREAGSALEASFGAPIEVTYKDAGPGSGRPFSAVSDVDRDVEARLRARIAERFPDHGVIGEELATEALERDWLWVLDPLDGTANFVNGLPLFASSVGLLHRGVPLVGAVWCASTHRLGPGVYHARRGAPLGFEGASYDPRGARGVLRRLAGMPAREAGRGREVEHRVLGSASSECAYVAAGFLRSSLLRRMAIWDVAAGVLLVAEAGLPVLYGDGGSWRAFERFDGTPLRRWRRTLLLGEPDPREMPDP